MSMFRLSKSQSAPLIIHDLSPGLLQK